MNNTETSGMGTFFIRIEPQGSPTDFRSTKEEFYSKNMSHITCEIMTPFKCFRPIDGLSLGRTNQGSVERRQFCVEFRGTVATVHISNLC